MRPKCNMITREVHLSKVKLLPDDICHPATVTNVTFAIF